MLYFKAFSATTLIALGTDKILMGRKGELGPIDPQMTSGRDGAPSDFFPMTISTEDIPSYLSFIKDKVGITSQDALANLTKSLADALCPPILGQINRVHSYARAIAEKMLRQVKPTLTDAEIQNVITALTECTFIHGHSVGRREAKQMGLQVSDMDGELEELCWDLFLQYEKDLNLNSFENTLAYFDDDDKDVYEEDNAVVACIESSARCHEYSGPMQLKRIRRIPPQLNLSIMPPSQPSGNDSDQNTSSQDKRMSEQMRQDLVRQVEDMITAQLRRNMPVDRIDIHAEKIVWREV